MFAIVCSSPYPEGGKGHIQLPPSTPLAWCGASMNPVKRPAALEANAPLVLAYDSGAMRQRVRWGRP